MAMKKSVLWVGVATVAGALSMLGGGAVERSGAAERDAVYQGWARQGEELAGRQALSPVARPETAAGLYHYLAGTVWEISDGHPDGEVLYTLNFHADGTFLHSDGRTGIWCPQSPRDLKLWDWDPVALNDDLTRFRAVGTGVIYFGKLRE
jgi:hypothetical protein